MRGRIKVRIKVRVKVRASVRARVRARVRVSVRVFNTLRRPKVTFGTWNKAQSQD